MLREHKKRTIGLIFENPTEGTTVSLVYNGDNVDEDSTAVNTVVMYSVSGADWNYYASGDPVEIPMDGYVAFVAESEIDNWDACDQQQKPFGRFYIDRGRCECSGDAMYLLSSNLSVTNVPQNAFKGLFKECEITKAPEISATTVGDSAMESMFEGCKDLLTPPSILYSNHLCEYSYKRMFYECSNLEHTPALEFKSSEIAGAYEMFKKCEKITSVDLHITTLAPRCMQSMFEDCTSLCYIRCRFIKWPEYRSGNPYIPTPEIEDATRNWTKNVAEHGTFQRISALPLYINNKPGQGVDDYSGETYNWDAVNQVQYNTIGMYHFDPWCTKGDVNLTDEPSCAVMYKTIGFKSAGTVRFDILSSYALTRDTSNLQYNNTLLLTQDYVEKLDDYSSFDPDADSPYDPRHAGILDITKLIHESAGWTSDSQEATQLAGFNFEGQNKNYCYFTPYKDVIIDWGDGTTTTIPKNRYVIADQNFVEGTSAGDPIGGIITHTYDSTAVSANEDGFYINVYSEDLVDPDESFFAIEKLMPVSIGNYKYKGCMVPLFAGSDSNIEALLTPLLPIHMGNPVWYLTENGAEGTFPPIPALFFNNRAFKSVPTVSSEDTSTNPRDYMFFKNRLNLDNDLTNGIGLPFSIAYMFKDCVNLTYLPSLQAMEAPTPSTASDLTKLRNLYLGNSAMEGFAMGCTSVKQADLSVITGKTFSMACAFNGCSSLNQIDASKCIGSEFDTFDLGNDHSLPRFGETALWTCNVHDEYGDDGILITNSQAIADTKSDTTFNPGEGKHEWNPWKDKSIDDDWYLTFTNTSGSQRSVTLKNQRKLFASNVNGQRKLTLKLENGKTTVRDCHMHLLQYRGGSPGPNNTVNWFSDWLDITDDTLNGTTIHGNDIYPSTLTTENGYDFVWSCDVKNGDILQMRGVPASFGAIKPDTYNGTQYPRVMYNGTESASGAASRQLWTFDTTAYTNSSDYFMDLPKNQQGYPITYVDIAGGGKIQKTLNDACLYNNNPQNTVMFMADNNGQRDKMLKTNRMFTCINSPEFYYQFFGADFFEVSGKIDTFFDYLDVVAFDMNVVPPFTYYKLFSGTNIATAPDIYATVGPNRAEFAECFKNCTYLLSPAKMNIDERLIASPKNGPAIKYGFNYIFGPYVPMKNGIGPATSQENAHQFIYSGGYFAAVGTKNITQTIQFADSVGGMFEMYKGCTLLAWPTSNVATYNKHPHQLCFAFHKGSGALYNNETNALESMFEGCLNIGTFGLVTYSKKNLQFDTDDESKFREKPMKNMFKDCTSGDNYLWDCYYTCASLVKYSKFGGRSGVKNSWQGGSPTQNWLQNVNVAKIYTNCAKHDPADLWFVPIIDVWTGNDRVGTCSSAAWQNAYGQHINDPDIGEVTQNHNNPWVRWHTAKNTNMYIHTWRKDSLGNQMTLANIQ